mgnify:CR=1 FL=1
MTLQFVDEPAAVRPIQSQFRNTMHTYQSVDAWTKAQDTLLYFAWDSPDEKFLVVQDWPDGKETILAESTMQDMHTGARQRWIFDDTAVLFRPNPDEHAIVELANPMRPRPVDAIQGMGTRQVFDHGDEVVVMNGPEKPAPIKVANLRTGAMRPILTVDDAVAALPPDLYDPDCTYLFSHPVFNRSRSRMFFKLLKSPGDPLRHCAMFALNVETHSLVCLGRRISGHPFWLHDDRHILNIKSLKPQVGDPSEKYSTYHLVTVDSETGIDRPLFDFEFQGPGHPAESPKGRYIVTDTFPFDKPCSEVLLFDNAENTVRKLASLPHSFKAGLDTGADDIRRAQPHPIWAPCGTMILANCNMNATRMQLHLIECPELA